MTTTDTPPTKAVTRGRKRMVLDASSSTSAVDALAETPAPGERDELVERLHLHPLNPAHRHDTGFEGLAELIRAQGKIREKLLVRPHPLISDEFEVLSGARRLAAAQMLGMLMVPVEVVDVDDATAVEEVLAGNLERQAFTESEEAALVQGALDLGVSEADVVAKLGRTREWVTRRKAVAALDPAARAVVDTAPEIDLVRAAAVAEFADDPEVYADLVEGITDSTFDHAVERARADRGRAQMRQERVDEILASDPGMTILDERPSTRRADDTAKGLFDLAATAGGQKITPAEHEPCAGRAVFVDVHWYGSSDVIVREEHYCLTWKTSGHYARHATSSSGATSGPMADEQKAERKHLIETNKAAEAAQVVRRRWLGEFLNSNVMPKNAVAAALLFLKAPYASSLEWTLAAELYGTSWSDSPAKAVNRLVALGCATLESTMPKDYWRAAASPKRKNGTTRPAMYLAQLAEWGYALAPHEQDVVDGAAAVKGAS